MIMEEIKGNDDNPTQENHFAWRTVILLAIATSIDALATGVIFTSTPNIIALAVIVIALGSFLFSCLGLWIAVIWMLGFCFKRI